MWLKVIDYFLAAIGLLGHLALLLILVRRHLLARLPAFAVLIAFYLLRSVLLLVPHFAREWPASYWVLIYLDPGLQLLVLAAMGVVAWNSTKGISGRAAVTVAVTCFLIVAAVVAWFTGYSSHFSPQNISVKLNMFVSALWIETAAGLVILLRHRESAAKRLSAGVALGFAVYSAANLLTEIVHTHFALVRKPALYTGLSYFRVIVYLTCLLGWSIFLLYDRPRMSPTFNTIDA